MTNSCNVLKYGSAIVYLDTLRVLYLNRSRLYNDGCFHIIEGAQECKFKIFIISNRIKRPVPRAVMKIVFYKVNVMGTLSHECNSGM